MRSLNYGGDELIGRFADIDDIHLGARNHDVARLHLRYLQYALDHRQRVGIEQVALKGGMQQLDQLLAILRLAHDQRREPFEQRGSVAGVVHIFI